MTNEVTYSRGKIQRVLRRKKMMIVEEEELVTEEIVEEPSEVMFPKVILHEVPLFQHAAISLEDQAMDDLEERKELAKIVGLANVPMKTEAAFEDIIGIFDSVTSEKQLDTVKMVKAVRRRC